MGKRPAICASGQDVDRHKIKYIDPFIGSTNFTHTIRTSFDDIPAGTQAKIKKSWISNGKLCVRIETPIKSTVTHASKLEKPGEIPENSGFTYERALVKRLSEYKIALNRNAGSTSGHDFYLIKNNGNVLTGEAKLGTKADYGQITLRYSKSSGWEIRDRSRKNRPKFAQTVDTIKINGILIYDYLNSNFSDSDQPPDNLKRHKNITVDHPNLDPARAYLDDHGAKILQVSSYGLYKCTPRDPIGLQLRQISGKGRWVIRQKTNNHSARTVCFTIPSVTALVPSHVDLDKDEDILKVKRKLGYD